MLELFARISIILTLDHIYFVRIAVMHQLLVFRMAVIGFVSLNFRR